MKTIYLFTEDLATAKQVAKYCNIPEGEAIFVDRNWRHFIRGHGKEIYFVNGENRPDVNEIRHQCKTLNWNIQYGIPERRISAT